MVHVDGLSVAINVCHDYDRHVHPDNFVLSIPRLQTPARNPDVNFPVRNDRMPESHRLAVDGLAFGVFLQSSVPGKVCMVTRARASSDLAVSQLIFSISNSFT